MMLPMNTAKQLDGVDTINTFLVADMPKEPKISADTMMKQTLVSNEWNKAYIAMLPTCFLCKVPLVWHTNPGKDAVLFHCPECKTMWKKDRNWSRDVGKLVKGIADD